MLFQLNFFVMSAAEVHRFISLRINYNNRFKPEMAPPVYFTVETVLLLFYRIFSFLIVFQHEEFLKQFESQEQRVGFNSCFTANQTNKSKNVLTTATV